MNHLDLLASEAHRLLDLFIEADAAYHSAPVDNHKRELDVATSADYAARTVVHVRAHAIAYQYCGAIEHLRDAIRTEANPLVREHLDGVLAKLLAQTECATTEACASPSSP
ncbi:MAG: hypothetical protein ACRDBH_09675 [Bosea sp. (in: a-proteobacteria)]